MLGDFMLGQPCAWWPLGLRKEARQVVVSKRYNVPRASISITMLEDADFWALMDKGQSGAAALGRFVSLILLAKKLNNGGVFGGPRRLYASMMACTEAELEATFRAIEEACELTGSLPWVVRSPESFTIRSFPKWNNGWGGKRPESGRPKESRRNQDANQDVIKKRIKSNQDLFKTSMPASSSASVSSSVHPDGCTSECREPTAKPVAARQHTARRSRISWSIDGGWTGIQDADREQWGKAFPACDLDRQLAAMGVWLEANPSKARKSAWTRFISNWLTRSQDKGGDIKSNGVKNGHVPVAVDFEHERIKQRSERIKNMLSEVDANEQE